MWSMSVVRRDNEPFNNLNEDIYWTFSISVVTGIALLILDTVSVVWNLSLVLIDEQEINMEAKDKVRSQS